jgi:sodium-dependent dicarboxylate transporter 2/3/5
LIGSHARNDRTLFWVHPDFPDAVYAMKRSKQPHSHIDQDKNTEAEVGKSTFFICVTLGLCCAVLMIVQPPPGLSMAGQKVLGIALLTIGFWGTEILPPGVTGMVVILLLNVSGSVSGFREALYGFSQPVVYFLVGVLTIGLAVSKSGLAERFARWSLQRSGGSSNKLFFQLLMSFPLLTLLLPSATTRSGILIHVYEQALVMGQISRHSPLAKAIMMALNSINRLASTILLTGGITPVLSAALVGGVSWTRWLLLMSIPYCVLLLAGSLLIYLIYRIGFEGAFTVTSGKVLPALTAIEIRTTIIIAITAFLWLTDTFHHLPPALPAVFAWICLLSPGFGVLTWKEFEKKFGWSNVFVIAGSLSLAHAIIESGAGEWIAGLLISGIPGFSEKPYVAISMMLLCSAPIRLLIPNITGFLSITIPIAMSIGSTMGFNPVLSGLMVMIVGDAVLYYPAQSASSLVVYERGFLSAAEIFRFGVLMTLIAILIVMFVAIPYWSWIGDPLILNR